MTTRRFCTSEENPMTCRDDFHSVSGADEREDPGSSPATTRRCFLGVSGATLLGALGASRPAAGLEAAPAAGTSGPDLPRLKVGLVTYNLARKWDVKTIIKNCTEAGFEAVELRTTHAHGVEVALSPQERKQVRALFQDSPVKLASLGSAFEYHSADPEVLRRNMEGTKEYAKLAADVGAEGIKVRPNGFPRGVSEEQTLRQIGESLAEVGEAAARVGIEIRVEVHGRGTNLLPNMKKIMDHAAHANVFVCWNSNQSDLSGDGLDANFKLVRDKIRFVHMRDLFREEYPWRKMLHLLRESGYAGYCCAEIPESSDPVRIMRYYRALFLAYQGLL
jgi:sugar phosphate isomerase/epimerase